MRACLLNGWVLVSGTLSLFFGHLPGALAENQGASATQQGSSSENWATAWKTLQAEARKKAPSLRLAREDSSAKGSAQWTTWTRWLPRVDLQLSQSQTQDYSFVTSGAFGTTGFSFEPQQVSLSRWTLLASLPLYQRSVHLETQAARSESQRADLKQMITEGEFDSRLQNLFGQFLAEEYALISTLSALETSQKSLKEAQIRFQVGQKTRLDVLRAEAELSALESKKLTTLERRATALNQLIEWTGLSQEDLDRVPLFQLTPQHEEASHGSPSSPISLSQKEAALRSVLERFTSIEAPLTLLSPYLNPPSGNEQDAFLAIEKQLTENHPRVRLISAEEDLASTRGASALAAEFPQLNLQASMNKQGPDWDDALTPGQRSYAVQVTFSMPLFSFGSTFSRYRERTAIQESGVIQAQAQALSLRNQLRNDRTRILTLVQAERAQKLAIRQNEELAMLSFKTYQLGRASLLEVLSAQNAALEARSQWVRTRVELASLVSAYQWNLFGTQQESTL